jgi:hypothetical protein
MGVKSLNNEMDGSCGKYGGEQKLIQDTGEGNQWRAQEFCLGGGGSTNSVEDRGQRERGSEGGSPPI